MRGEFRIRQATPQDEAAVSALLHASYPALMAPAYDAALLRAALPAIARANPALLASGTYFVAEAGAGRPVGCGGWTTERPGGGVEPGLGHVRHFATHADWAGRGVGRALSAACETQARTRGVGAFECYASLNAEGFYAALGFETLGPMQVHLGPDLAFPALRMRRAL